MVKLNIDNLNATYFDGDNNIYELEFIINNTIVTVQVNADDFEEASVNEWYWDNEDNVNRAVEMGEVMSDGSGYGEHKSPCL